MLTVSFFLLYRLGLICRMRIISGAGDYCFLVARRGICLDGWYGVDLTFAWRLALFLGNIFVPEADRFCYTLTALVQCRLYIYRQYHTPEAYLFVVVILYQMMPFSPPISSNAVG